MPIYRLSSQLVFPNPTLAETNGILAVGGDLSPKRLLLAYCNGIFPWFNEGDPIIWWSPDPRMVLFPKDIHISKSMKKFMRKKIYNITCDRCFKKVIQKCAYVRNEGTWITQDMILAYTALHDLGFAHSIEVWADNNELVGGLYGISIGKCFFGESMFSLKENASKTALIYLSEKLNELGYLFIDCQVQTEHLKSMGAVNIPREEFLKLLEEGIKHETRIGNWSSYLT